MKNLKIFWKFWKYWNFLKKIKILLFVFNLKWIICFWKISKSENLKISKFWKKIWKSENPIFPIFVSKFEVSFFLWTNILLLNIFLLNICSTYLLHIYNQHGQSSIIDYKFDVTPYLAPKSILNFNFFKIYLIQYIKMLTKNEYNTFFRIKVISK